MKEHTHTIGEIIFTHPTAGNSWNSRRFPFINSLKKWALACRSHLINGAATLAIGSILLLAVYLFLSRLAEYGW